MLKHKIGTSKKKNIYRDFAGGPVVTDLPSDTGGVGSIPGRATKITYAVQQPCPCASATEPMLWRP